MNSQLHSEQDPSPLLDVQEVAFAFRCSERHVYRMADRGRIPRPIKLGSLVRWRRTELDKWMADGCPPIRVAKGGRR